MMERKYLFLTVLIFVFLSWAGCANFQLWEAQHGSIQIKTFIDGSDTIKIRGNELWFEHHNYDLPGKWQDRFDEPTMINDKEWKPQWNGLMSSRYKELDSALPQKNIEQITVTRELGRGEVNITSKPSEENEYTLSIFIDDDQYDGAEWYEIIVEW